eukprot:GHRR01000684.1.p1 GENE.GHRR01000684.1~~GHRR01000684.1.p1  ORF type:complete len:357 (+),score=72.23 GHRR01000684.1:191-1261(+)
MDQHHELDGVGAMSRTAVPQGTTNSVLSRALRQFNQVAWSPLTCKQKLVCAALWLSLAAILVVIFAIVTPRLVDRVINPLINWLQRSLTLPQIGGVIFVGIAILPFTLVISSIPLVWLAGIIFDFWVALGIVMAAAFVGMSGQFWLARYVLHDRVQRLVAAHTYKWVSVAFRAIESAGPWKVTLLLRLGPFPYSYLNYLLGVCPGITYPMYMVISFLAELIPRGLQVFFGRSLDTLADLLKGKVTNVGVAVYNIVVLLVGAGFVVISVIMSRRTLGELEQQEIAKEQAEAEEAMEAAAAAAPSAVLGYPGSLTPPPPHIEPVLEITTGKDTGLLNVQAYGRTDGTSTEPVRTSNSL